MFGWLKKRFKGRPSRQLEYFWKDRKQGRVVVSGQVLSAVGFHLVVTPLGRKHSGQHLVSKSQAIDQKQWQDLWDEENKGNTIEWVEPSSTGKQ